MLLKFAARDLSFVIVAVVLWRQLGYVSAGPGPLGDIVGVVLGFALAASAYLAHEWGHLLGAVASRSTFRAADQLGAVYLFSFDSRLNSRRQFLVMSFSGFVATGVVVWLAYTVLPDDELASRVARGAVLFLAFLGVFIEFPLVLWSILMPTLPPVEVFPAHRKEQKATPVCGPGAPSAPATRRR